MCASKRTRYSYEDSPECELVDDSDSGNAVVTGWEPPLAERTKYFRDPCVCEVGQTYTEHRLSSGTVTVPSTKTAVGRFSP